MSKTVTFRGQLADADQQRIKLATLKGKTGYRIKKFETISLQNTGGGVAGEHYTFIWSVKQSEPISATTPNIDFTDQTLLAVNWSPNNAERPFAKSIVFDTVTFNQDIYVTHMDIAGTEPNNYLIELEVINLSDLESTFHTLQNLKTISERTA
jgi:hypothetical protein